VVVANQENRESSAIEKIEAIRSRMSGNAPGNLPGNNAPLPVPETPRQRANALKLRANTLKAKIASRTAAHTNEKLKTATNPATGLEVALSNATAERRGGKRNTRRRIGMESRKTRRGGGRGRRRPAKRVPVQFGPKTYENTMKNVFNSMKKGVNEARSWGDFQIEEDAKKKKKGGRRSRTRKNRRNH
jgi:hypothetical protein